MSPKTLTVKVTIPRIIQDNPKVTFETRDGTFSQEAPLTSTINRWMQGKNEAYFELQMSATHIISMRPTTEEKYNATPGKTDEKLPE